MWIILYTDETVLVTWVEITGSHLYLAKQQQINYKQTELPNQNKKEAPNDCTNSQCRKFPKTVVTHLGTNLWTF